MRINYHTHTLRCKHANGTESDYVNAALEAGLTILGFSDHAPFPDEDYGLRMAYSELDEYLTVLEDLKQKNADLIQIRKSLEIEYLPKYHSYYEVLLTQKGMDHLLLGEHFFDGADGSRKNIFFAESTEDYVDYAKAISAALDTGYFAMVAHPDIYCLNPFAWDKNCDIAMDLILNAAAKNHTVLEYNANGIRRGITDFPDGARYRYPHAKFWRTVATTDIPVIVGSDCHDPSQIYDASVDTAYQEVKDLGIDPIFKI